MSLSQIPTLDISQFATDKDNFVNQVGEAYKQFGFCGFSNHGVTDELIERAFTVTQAFFELPTKVKQQYFIANQGGARGYTAKGVEKAKNSDHVDLKEFWHVGREIAGQAPHISLFPNVWPKEVSDFKQVTLALYKSLENLSVQILSALALVIKQPENYFEDKLCFGNSVLRLIHYPPVEDTSTPSIRAGQHEDINLITLLVGSHQAGLEILKRDGSWLPVTMLPGAIVVNIGDMLQRLTNNVLPSTTHRVVNPQGDKHNHSRYSMPFFVHPNPEFVIDSLSSCISEDNPNRYETPISANDYLTQRLHEIGLMD